MKLEPIGNNQTELTIGRNVILFSYQTPVAAITENGIFKTEKFHSQTTSKHVNNWVKKLSSGFVYMRTKPQDFFDNLVK